MTYEVREFPVTIPPGTAIATPQVTAMTMPSRVIRRVHVLFPPGPFGQVGVQLGMAGQQIIPYASGQWLIGDDRELAFDLAGMPDSGAWQLIGYNVGTYPHTVYVTFEVDPPQKAGVGAGASVPAPLSLGS